MKNKLLMISILLMLLTSVFGTTFKIPARAQPETPVLRVEPSVYEARYPGETFDINITLNNINADWNAVIVQFRLGYDATLLECVSCTEGDFLKGYAPYGTYFLYYPESDKVYCPHVLCGIMINPDPETGVWEPPFPEGSGTLATITFRVIDFSGECALHFIDDEETYILNDELEVLPRKLQDGQFYFYPSFRVEPSVYQARYPGETFDINITLNNINADWNAVIVQFRLGYNDTLLEFVSCTEGDFLKGYAPYGTYFLYYPEPDGVHGPHVLCGIMINPDPETGVWEPPFPEGSGTLATITFKVVSKVPGECALHFIDDEETYILNDELEVLPRKLQDGVYRIERIPPHATIAVEPTEYTAHALNETFSINITISDVDAAWRMIAVEFRLCYPLTVPWLDPALHVPFLEVVDVTEGPFLKDPRWNVYGTFFISYVEDDGIYGPHVLVGILLLPNPDTGEYDQPQFPEGSGTLATITFKALYQERGEITELFPTNLTLRATMIINSDLKEVPHIVEPSKVIYYMTPAFIYDLNGDGKVDMKDIAPAAKAFGSFPGHERWNPICDITGPEGVPDGKVDMRDVAAIARRFGWTA